jgi:hypothetical protein
LFSGCAEKSVEKANFKGYNKIYLYILLKNAERVISATRWNISMNEPKRPASDAEWYCRKDPEAERFYEVFFEMCRKYHVRWCSASEKERAFIEEVTRVTYELDRAARLGSPTDSVRPTFAS